MRHGKAFNHLSRTAPHRKAMLSNMASSLILHKRIFTTLAKGKALRKYVEPLITKSKNDTTHSRRVVFSYLQNKESVKELFDEVSQKISARPGGYTRIIKTGNRLGDNSEMCLIELVDYNELLIQEDTPKKSKTRRSRRGSSSKAKSDTPATQTESKKEESEKEKETKAQPKSEEKTEAKAKKPDSDDTKTEKESKDDQK